MRSIANILKMFFSKAHTKEVIFCFFCKKKRADTLSFVSFFSYNDCSVQALAQLIPPVLSGFIAASFAPEAPLIAASVMIIFAGILYNVFYKAPPKPEHIPGY